MKGPLKTSIRNLTQQPIIYGVAHRIFLRPESETIYDYDIFTKLEGNKSLGNMLADVKRGRICITYIYDSEFTSAVPSNFTHIPLKVAEAMQSRMPREVKFVNTMDDFEARKARIRPDGTLPMGELPKDPSMGTNEVTPDMRPEQRLALSVANKVGIEKDATDAKVPDQIAELLAEQNLHSEPDKAVDKSVIEAPVVEIKPAAKRGGRKNKKDVVAL